MYFSRSFFVSVLATPLLALAQSTANPFTLDAGFAATAGDSANLTWTPTTPGTITLVLRSGASSNLNAGATIASNLPNSGSYVWDLPSSITRGSDYTVEIVSDSNPDDYNFSAYFVIDSTNTVASSTGDVTLGAPTASPSLSSASGASTSGSATGSSHSASTTGSSSASTASSGSSTATSTTGSAASSSSHASVTVSAAATSSTAATAPTNAAGRVQIAGGLLGVVALGALVI